MFFTQEDYRKIEKRLLANSRKDTDFAGAATPLKGNETVVLVQNGKNVKASIKDIVEQLFLLGVSDFVNITDKYGESYISLSQAIELIPYRSRKIGQVVTFLDDTGKWAMFQFQGTRKNQWGTLSLWVDLIDLMAGLTITDSEDIVTETNSTNQVALKFADKTYNEADYSGLGRVYLRKNIVAVEDPVTSNIVTMNYLQQSMISKENTIYIIQYDYNLNGQTITIPAGCTLDFQGGTFNNGTIILSSGIYFKGTNTKFNEVFLKYNSNISNVKIEGIEFIGSKNTNAQNADELTAAIRYTSEVSIDVLLIRNCIIHGYNSGIMLKASNAIIEDNTFYDNGALGTIVGVHDGEVDVSFYAATSNIKNNIIIKNNKCLSNYVHRNIDAGELKAETNVIIDGNICISQSSLNVEDPVTLRKSICIMVGYRGVQDFNTPIIICNNICKHSSWSGIYIRGTNPSDVDYKTKYIANIHNNYLENITQVGNNTYFGAIAVVLKEGSIIESNTIVKCTQGINLGFIHKDSHTSVIGNTILDCNWAIWNDSYSYNLNIQSNTIKKAVVGIVVNEVAASATDTASKQATILDNVIELSSEGNVGIRIYTYYGKNLKVDGNTIYCIKGTGIGIQIVQLSTSTEVYPYVISNNNLNNLNIGIQIEPTTFLRNEGRYVDFNRFFNCTTGIVFNTNLSGSLFVVEGNSFQSCDNIFNSQKGISALFEGKHKTNDTFIIYDNYEGVDYNNSTYGYLVDPPVCFRKKKFLEGDEVVSFKGYFSKAICQTSAPDASSDSYSKWKVEGGAMTTQVSNFCAVTGQIVYDSTLKKGKLWNGTAWVNLDGTALA